MSNWMITYDEIKKSGDQKQLDFIDNITRMDRNSWVQGLAGSGKSVVLVHSLVNIINQNQNATICIVVFTKSLIEMFKAGLKELNVQGKVKLVTYQQFVKDNTVYDYIFCDEVQDLPPSVLEKMKEKAKIQLIVAGDSNQSIYDKAPGTQEPVVNVSQIGNLTNAKTYELTTIHRLTKSVINAISKLIPNLNIFAAKKNRTKQDINIRLAKGTNKTQECEYILSEAETALENDQSVVVLLPYHNTIEEFINIILELKNIQPWEVEENQWGKPDYRKLHYYLNANNVNIEYIGNGYGDLYSANSKKIIVMTYHSAKGLDFDNVFLPFLTPNTFNSYFTETLFMVGMTRSKNNLYLTYSGSMHRYVKSFSEECVLIDIDELQNSSDDDIDFDF